MAIFERVLRFVDSDIPMPVRKTKESAGYDMVAAQDIIIPSYRSQLTKINDYISENNDLRSYYTVEEMSAITKITGAKPTLVSTGMKCKLDPGTYLELSVRSSSPLKYWLILANGVGIIDADYYDNVDNEGEIFFQLINLAPFNILIKKGDAIGQGIIKRYEICGNDAAAGVRVGGFGSTDGATTNL